jgi:esterase/lipase superfamily enzyme
MLVVTNRNINTKAIKNGIGDEKSFGDQLNRKGANEIRFAYATSTAKGWRIELVPETGTMTAASLPSKTVFETLFDHCQKNQKHALLYTHGYGKDFKEALDQGLVLEKRYGVEVVLFTWPSDPGGFINKVTEYREIKRIAMASGGAFDRLLELIGTYGQNVRFDRERLVNCRSSLNLMVYSMGAYMLQNYVISSLYGKETGIFQNVVVCQADCDNEKHENWLERLAAGQRVYVTINENDKILGWSDANGQPDRLGRTVRNLRAKNATYVDFTAAKTVGNEHQIWGSSVKNSNVKDFFDAVFSGERGESLPNFAYDVPYNVYRCMA